MTAQDKEPTLESRRVFRGKILNLRVDQIALSTGATTSREIVEHGACVCIVALDSQDQLLLVRQYRKPAEAFLLELPSGGMEPGESPAQTALRELQEETGHTATTLTHLSSFWMSPGYCTEEMHAYLATGLSPSSLQPDEDEVIETVKVPLAQAITMVRSGEIRDAKSIAALMLVAVGLDSHQSGGYATR